MNYTELLSAVKGYVENDFPDTVGDFSSQAQVDAFIRQAEQRVYNTVQLLDLRRSVTGNTTAGNPYLTVPTDWLANFSLAVIDLVTSEYSYLLNKDVNFIREAFPSQGYQAKPTHYAMFDKDSILLGPTPDANYPVQLHYFYYPESIVTASTTWLGDHFDSVLLYGTLLEAYTFMKGETDILASYQKRYDEAMLMLKMFAEGKNRQDMYRTKQIRFPVQ